jgi:hypothetical protein
MDLFEDLEACVLYEKAKIPSAVHWEEWQWVFGSVSPQHIMLFQALRLKGIFSGRAEESPTLKAGFFTNLLFVLYG